MPLALIKLTATDEFVGIFAFETVDDLRGSVDQFCAPSECSWARLPSGGIGSLDKTDVALPLPQPETDPFERTTLAALFGPLTLTSELEAALVSKDLSWARLDPGAEHEGSLLDALLKSPQGRDRIAGLVRQKTSVSLP